ncbi:DUF6463 family protein [Microlunatus sp. Y2014]|uniref:DUF6463 family protein n=1 Tax=Microlunatus sp. Y2014 TaxID=3418488 RepID=UPI003DA73C58
MTTSTSPVREEAAGNARVAGRWTPATALGLIGAIHLAAGPVIYPEALHSIVAGGVAAAIESDAGLLHLRATGFWYLTAGLGLIIIAVLMRALERQGAPSPRSAPWSLAVLAVWGVVLMPASGFWAILAVAVWGVVRDPRARPRRALPIVAAVCSSSYAVGHAWWTATGPPPFVRVESVFVGGWLVVGVAGVAALVSAGIAFSSFFTSHDDGDCESSGLDRPSH